MLHNKITPELVSQWSNLVARNGLEPTQFPGWLQCIADSFDQYTDIQVCTSSDGDKINGVIPFFMGKDYICGLPLKYINYACNLISYHQGYLCNDDVSFDRLLLSSGKNTWDVFRINNIVEGSKLEHVLIDMCNRNNWACNLIVGDNSPYIPINSDWDSFLASKSRNFRYRIKRKEKGINKAGNVMVKWFLRNSDTEKLIHDIFTIEGRSWKVGAGMSIVHRPQEMRYYQSLIPYMDENNLLRANVLYLDNEPIAYSLCYEFKKKWGQLKTSFDDRYSSISPGIYIVDVAIHKAFDNEAVEFDFLGPSMPHKLEWTNYTRKHNSYEIYNNTIPGYLVGRMKALKYRNDLGRLIEAAKRLTDFNIAH